MANNVFEVIPHPTTPTKKIHPVVLCSFLYDGPDASFDSDDSVGSDGSVGSDSSGGSDSLLSKLLKQ